MTVTFAPKGTAVSQPARTGMGYVRRPVEEDSIVVPTPGGSVVVPLAAVLEAIPRAKRRPRARR